MRGLHNGWNFGALGGSVQNPFKGFGTNRELARYAGKLGGTISTRGPDKRTPEERARIRKRFEKNYAHLLAIHRKSNPQTD